ncbi:aldo/keto reductase [Jatrophihabitans sp. YIM 134969]
MTTAPDPTTRPPTRATTTRTLGRTGLTVSAIGLGTWPIGGAMRRASADLGYTGVDDAESLRALAAAVDLGVTLFDSSDVYGAGHAERLLGRALAGRPEVLVATKFGNTFDEATRELTGVDTSPVGVRAALTASLRRLGRDHVDVYQLHTPGIPAEQVGDLIAVLEDFVAEGTVRWYGVSTDFPSELEPLLAGEHFGVLQAQCNVLDGPAASVAPGREHGLGLLLRSPLAMGLLGGGHRPDTPLPEDDVRHHQPEWLTWFAGGVPTEQAWNRLSDVRDVLTSGGRTLAQGALAWVLATEPDAVPLPGFRTAVQVEDTLGTLQAPPMTTAELDQVASALGRDTMTG